MKKKKVNEKRLLIKMILSILYIIIITILLLCSYKIYKDSNNIKSLSEIESLDDYTYIEIYKMSEKFAYYEDLDIGIHFAIDKEVTGQWHTYLVAIKEKEYNKYKDIIDYSYGKIKKQPKPIKAYGYPIKTSTELKKMAINNINNFIPSENQVQITEANYETYLTNCYLDTTRSEENKFNTYLFFIIVLLLITVYSFVLTIMDKSIILKKIERKLR